MTSRPVRRGRRYATPVLAGLLAVAAAGCFAPPGSRLAPADPAAVRGGTLTVGITAPGAVDPGLAYEPMGELVDATMCDPLIQADPLTGALVPGLATSWLVTGNGTRIILRLRPGVRFSDGSALTADAVVASLSRVASAGLASAAAPVLDEIVGYPEVHGDVLTNNPLPRNTLAGVVALDQQTVQISLVAPDAQFLRALTLPLADPVSPTALHRDPAGFESQPVCVGPYRLAAPWSPGQTTISLIRVPGYHGAVAGYTGGGAGYLDAITFRVFPTAAAAAHAVATGAVDLAPDAPGVPLPPGAAAVSVTTGLEEYVGLPDDTAPFDRPAVRIALSEALDRAAIVAALFPGTRRPAGGFLPPTVGASYTPHACGAATPPDGDPAAARATLRAAQVSLAGTTLGLYFNDDFRNGALAAAVARQWRSSFKLDVVLHPMSFPAFLAAGSAVGGLPGAFRFSWQPPYPSADGYLAPLFTSAAIGANNFSRFADPTFDLLLTNTARRADSAADRVLAYRSANSLLCRQMPMIPLTYSVARWLVRAGVASTRPGYLDVTDGEPLLRELYLGSAGPPPR